MSNYDIVKLRGTTQAYKDDSGGGVTIPSAVLGIVKNNIDPTRSGRIEVYIKRKGASDPDDPAYWLPVRYMSPFFGTTRNIGSPDDDGKYIGNPNSYGFWATPPDVDSEVICIFLNGDPTQGYYIGGALKPGLNHMTPAIGSSNQVILNEGESKTYGGATLLPVTEINDANSKQDNNLNLANQARPVHSYHAATLYKQGLIRDPIRGTISSSSMRETPSRVFGISTPGRPIYQGGYTDETIKSAVKDKNTPNKNFQIIGRRGGHSFVMDDGDLTGKDQLVRLRTSSGHMIMMNDKEQTMFIIHSNGHSYIELGKEGTVDIYATNSINLRTMGDLNFHADRDINMFAKRNFTVNAEKVQLESEKDFNKVVGGNNAEYVVGNHTVLSDGSIGLKAASEASMEAGGPAYVVGSKVLLNSGTAGITPEAVEQVQKTILTDTKYDSEKGYAPAPKSLVSIVNRAPAHSPWEDANKGVDVEVDFAIGAGGGESPAAQAENTTQENNLQKVNDTATNSSPTEKTSAVLSTTVEAKAASNNVDKSTTGALVSQMAIQASTGPLKDAVKEGAKVVDVNGAKTAALGQLAMTPTQLVAAGYLKPGSDALINQNIQNGMSIKDAIPVNLWTGKDGVADYTTFVQSHRSQQNAASILLQKGEQALLQTGLLKGNESVTQTAGLILSTAVAGIGPTVDYAKNLINSTNVTLNQSSLPSNPMNTLNGSVSNLISGGNFAGNMIDKLGFGLTSGISSVLASVKGAAAGAFNSIVGKFKNLQANKPITLDAGGSTSGNNSDSNVTNSLTSLESVGLNSVKTTGVKTIQDSIKTVTNLSTSSINVVESTTNNMIGKLKGNSLETFATTNMDSASQNDLQNAISSLGNLGSEPSKLIKAAEDTIQTVEAVQKKAKTLLGDNRIPPLA